MDKRAFLKGSGAVVAGALLSKMSHGQTGGANVEQRTNWAGNYTYSAKHLDTPGDVAQVRQAISGHTEVKALGARHSFNGIADSKEDQISLKSFDSDGAGWKSADGDGGRGCDVRAACSVYRWSWVMRYTIWLRCHISRW